MGRMQVRSLEDALPPPCSRGLSEVQIGEGAMAALVVVTSYTDAELA